MRPPKAAGVFRLLSLSKNLIDWEEGGKKQGEYEGTGVPSCWIECLQKACYHRRLRREAAAFWTVKQSEK